MFGGSVGCYAEAGGGLDVRFVARVEGDVFEGFAEVALDCASRILPLVSLDFDRVTSSNLRRVAAQWMCCRLWSERNR